MNHDLHRTSVYYERQLAGDAAWRSSYVQDVACLTLARVEGLRDGVSVLDVGCGLGALYGYLQQAGLRVDYTGIDASEKVIAAARQRYPGGRFEVRDILSNPPRDRYDFVLSSGALHAKVARQESFDMDMIATMYGLAGTALAFSALSANAFMTTPQLQISPSPVHYMWPDQTLAFCKTQSQHVALAHDTDSGMFFAYIYRRPVGALARYLAYTKPGKTYSHAVQAAIDYHVELGLYDELRTFLYGVEPCAPVWLYLGYAHAMVGDVAAAETALRNAIDADPKVPWAYIQIGYLFSRQGDLVRAVAAAKRAIEAAPDEIEAHQALVKILFAHKQLTEARAAAAAMPDGPVADTLRAATAETPAAALAALDRAIGAAPAYLPALVERAEVLEAKGDRAAAIAAWQNALRIAPADRSIQRKLDHLTKGTPP